MSSSILFPRWAAFGALALCGGMPVLLAMAQVDADWIMVSVVFSGVALCLLTRAVLDGRPQPAAPRSRGEPFAQPAVVVAVTPAPVAQPVVQPALAALPELPALGHQPIAAPMRRARR